MLFAILLLVLCRSSRGFSSSQSQFRSVLVKPFSHTTTPPLRPTTSSALKVSPLSFITEETKNQIFVSLATTSIKTIIPVLGAVYVIGKFSDREKKKNSQQPLNYANLYDEEGSDDDFPFPSFMKMKKATELAPKEQYIKVRKLNDVYQSYEYSLNLARSGKSSATVKFLQSQQFAKKEQILNLVSNLLESGEGSPAHPSTQKRLIAEFEEYEAELLTKSREPLAEIAKASSQFSDAISDEYFLSEDGNKVKPNLKLTAKIGDANLLLVANELLFLQKVVNSVLNATMTNGVGDSDLESRKEQAKDLLKLFFEQGAFSKPGSLINFLEERPLTAILKNNNDKSGLRKSAFVLDFSGDVTASQCNELREEVTAILSTKREGDEVILVLKSGGGTVTGYGAAAGQLQRLKNNGIKLTIAVEEVAAR